MVSNERNRFEWIIGNRDPKPRDSGLTMVIGDGPFNVGGLRGMKDLVELAGPWFDWYKFIWASFPFQPQPLMERKIALLAEHDITSFIGGNFLEAAIAEGSGLRLLENLRDAGCPGVEVSSTVVDLSLNEKVELIEQASELGLHVHGEVGRKSSEATEGALSIAQIIEDMQVCLKAGADIVIFEMEEISELADKTEALDRITAEVDPQDIMFEVPLADFYEVMATSWWFIERLGPTVNLGNVNPNHVLLIEQQRRGIGPLSVAPE